MAFIGPGQNDSGGQAIPSVQQATTVWQTLASYTPILFTAASRGPQNNGVLYTTGGGGSTTGYGQIFPTGRS
jgi:hypothetical protein